MANLFRNETDLLGEFGNFLPEAGGSHVSDGAVFVLSFFSRIEDRDCPCHDGVGFEAFDAFA